MYAGSMVRAYQLQKITDKEWSYKNQLPFRYRYILKLISEFHLAELSKGWAALKLMQLLCRDTVGSTTARQAS